MTDRDLYTVLEVARGATQDEIKKSYRKLARELHPDRNPGDAEAEKRFKEVAYAYEVLNDDGKRKLYDEFGEVGLKDGFDPEAYRQYQAWQRAGGGRPAGYGDGNLEDLFRDVGSRGGGGSFFNLEDLFGGRGLDDLFGGGRGQQAAPTRGIDLTSEIRVGFADALRGVERELTFAPPQGGPRSIKVRIPAGVRDGGKVRLRGQGGAGPAGGAKGDLVLTVRVDDHPWFRREGEDLHLKLPITAREAWEGTKIRVPTLEGDVTLSVPAKSQGGATLRLRNRGVKRGKTTGDLYVHLQVVLPDGDSERIGELLKELEDTYEGSPRAGIRL